MSYYTFARSLTLLFAISVIAISTHMRQNAAYGATTAIMPLGDSITLGGTLGGVVPGGYRAQLYARLTEAKSSFIFVGSASDNPSTALTNAGQIHHEGHSGYRIDQIDANLYGSLPVLIPGDSGYNGGYWLSGTADREAIVPDVFLIMIGINDIASGVSATTVRNRMDTLLGHIVAGRPNTALIVASLTPHATPAIESVVQEYNAMLPGVVAKYAANGTKAYFLDMHSKLTLADISDGVHPNQAGYDKMGNAWFDALQTHGLAVPEPSATALLTLGAISLAVHASWRQR